MKAKTLILFGFLSVLLFSCQPYDDGPKISLRSADAKFQQVWLLNSIEYSSGSVVTPSTSIKYEFKEDGNLIITTDGDEFDATWQIKDKTNLTITYSETSSEEYKILRLSKTDLWIELSSGLFTNKFISVD